MATVKVIGTSAITLEREIAKTRLTEWYTQNLTWPTVTALLGNMEIVLITKKGDFVTIEAYKTFTREGLRFVINDYECTDPIDCMYKWGSHYSSHIIGYAYESEE